MHAYHGGAASSGRHGVVGKYDFIMMDNFVQDMVNDGGDDDDEDNGEAVLEDPKDAKFFEDFINHLDSDDLLHENPRWLDNFKEMKKAANDRSIRIVRMNGRCCVFNL